ncbi:MAG TPA: hypothetical protein VGF67_34090 [Ktedonobacteraceae bacterium]
MPAPDGRRQASGMSEPDTGSDTAHIRTRAVLAAHGIPGHLSLSRVEHSGLLDPGNATFPGGLSPEHISTGT